MIANIDMFVLDVLRHDDVEQLDGIAELINSDSCIGWRDHLERDCTTEEISDALRRLLRRGDVEALADVSPNGVRSVPTASVLMQQDLGSVWFRLTKQGRNTWERWEPPVP